MSRAQRTLTTTLSEYEWMEHVTSVARMVGFLVYHTHDSRHSEAGFPDLILVKGKYLLAIELKRNKKLRPTSAQLRWLHAFAGVTHVRAAVWTPEDKHRIYDELAKFARDANQ